MMKPGDPVVYQLSKVSTDPGPRAHDVHPAEFGETYQYLVDKYWKVADVLADGMVVLDVVKLAIYEIQDAHRSAWRRG